MLKSLAKEKKGESNCFWPKLKHFFSFSIHFVDFLFALIFSQHFSFKSKIKKNFVCRRLTFPRTFFGGRALFREELFGKTFGKGKEKGRIDYIFSLLLFFLLQDCLFLLEKT
jgi:hypothetical protein